MKTRSALLASAVLCAALLLPAAARADGDPQDKNERKVKVKAYKVVSISDSHGFLGVGVADVDEDRAKGGWPDWTSGLMALTGVERGGR